MLSFLHRKPSLKPSSYSASPVITSPRPPTPPPRDIIHVAEKEKCRKQSRNVFTDDRGFPDLTNDYDTLLHNIDGGPVLRKLRHPALPLDETDPSFNFLFDEALHGERLCQLLDLSHLDVALQTRIYNLIKKYWSVFNDRWVWVPVKNYECVIDTGDAPPIAVKNIRYGPKEIPIMRNTVAALEKVGHICQMHDGRWLFKCVLAAKPHQEHVRDIADFVWRFCVNYVPLNSVTRIITYPIPCCDSAVFVEFGNGQFLWLFDAPSGYHQLAVEKRARRNWHSKDQMQSNGRTRSCPLTQLMGPLPSST